MKQIVLAGMLLTATISASATTFYEQLCTFNFNWKKYSMIAPKGEARTFETDADYVAAHLSCVIPILKSNPTDQLTSDRLETRLNLIELLDGYREAKLFPLNHYRNERIPVFIDEHGTHCAVGYLMMKSGYEDLAQRISRNDNYVWVKDIKDQEAIAWQNYSGFTMEELKLIQGAYDWYDPMAWYTPNKFETPQMPICTTAYFDDSYGKSTYNPYGVYILDAGSSTKKAKQPEVKDKSEKNVWCKGQGNGKVINGIWEQNYGPGLPWIKGFFINGQRSGDWEEYYPGTTTLCRTESWRNNKLNGVRKRFDRASRLIEEIIFVEGSAVCKTNYELNDSLTYVRIPQNDSIVSTRVYNNQGKLIACGKEEIYNPSGLLWFQNIELTALNSMQVSTRSTQQALGTGNASNFGNDGGYNSGSSVQSHSIQSLFGGGNSQPSLVQYHKIGTWWYYPEQSPLYARTHPGSHWFQKYQHYGSTLNEAVSMFTDVQQNAKYDSLKVEYTDNSVAQFHGYTEKKTTNFKFEYYTRNEYFGIDENINPNVIVIWNDWYYNYDVPKKKSAGQYNENGERIGEWYYYTTGGILKKKEEYLVPFKEEQSEEKIKGTVSK